MHVPGCALVAAFAFYPRVLSPLSLPRGRFISCVLSFHRNAERDR